MNRPYPSKAGRTPPNCCRAGGCRRRRGITLLEVLIATFVLTIGLLGLFSLVPVAKFFMADGTKYDRTSTLGQQALHELETRKELLDPSNWFSPAENGKFLEVCPASQPFDFSGVTHTVDGSYNYRWPTLSAVQTIPAAPFVLDPLACAFPANLAQNATTGAASSSGQLNVAGSYGPVFFPPSGFSLDGVGNPGSPAVARITVPRAGSVTTDGSGNRFCLPMTYKGAQTIFESSDDLLFENPKDPTQRPFVAPPSVATPGQWAKSAGDYSWFAVIDNMNRPWNPGPDGGWGIAGTNDNGPPIGSDTQVDDISEAGWPTGDPATEDIALWKTSGGQLWHIWVVTVYKRNLQLTPASSAEVPPERMCYCDFLSAPLPATTGSLNNAGIGGGDCVLFMPSTAPKEWLEVKPNQWVMMSAWPNLNSNISGTPVRGQLEIVQWFRLSAVGETQAVLDSSGNIKGWQRAVTLSGPDWNPYKFVDAIGAPGGNQSCYCTIVDGVTGVFEATIEQGQ